MPYFLTCHGYESELPLCAHPAGGGLLRLAGRCRHEDISEGGRRPGHSRSERALPVAQRLQFGPQRPPVAPVGVAFCGFLSREGVFHSGLILGDGEGEQRALAGNA